MAYEISYRETHKRLGLEHICNEILEILAELNPDFAGKIVMFVTKLISFVI